jgi:hypothetical protein
MEIYEKRSSPRYAIQISFRFRTIEAGSTEPEIVSETENISSSGLFMRSPVRLKVGAPLSLTLRVPTSISGSARSHIRCIGHIVREQALPTGQMGYGVQLDQLSSIAHPTPHSHIATTVNAEPCQKN